MKPLDICEMQNRITQLERDIELYKQANKSLKDAMDDERKIIEAQKYVMEAFQKERDALKVHCEGMRQALDIASDYSSEMLKNDAATIDYYLSYTPTQSLAETQAQAIEDAGLEYMRQHALSSGNPVTLFLKQHAKQLREGES